MPVVPLLHGGAGAGHRRPRHVLPYGVAFKLVAVSGLVTLPLCCWAFGRLARFRYPMPELFAFAGLCFALDESFSIYGGNLKSTMAGEFSFSIALSLMMLGLGLLANGDADRASTAAGRRSCSPWPSSATASSRSTSRRGRGGHRARPPRQRAPVLCSASASGVAVVLLSAFWVGPFLGNHEYMTDMKYGARPEGASDSFWDMFFPLTAPLDILITTLAVIGFVACVVRRHAQRHRARRHRRSLTVALVYAHPGQPAGHRAAVEPAPAAVDLPRRATC